MLTRRKLIATCGAVALAGLPPATILARPRAKPTVGPTSQLQNYNLRQLQASAADILVLDDSVSIDSRGRRTPTTLNRLQKKPDGGRRFVLAYLSIGDAEDCRYYWQPEWIEAAEASQPQPDPARPKETDQPQDQPAAPTAPARPAPPKPAKSGPLPLREDPSVAG